MKHPPRRLSDWWRVPRVLFYLATRPQDIGRYLRYGVLTRQTPLALGMPWWSFGAVEALRRRLTASHEVFEFGSGGSTVFLSARVGSITSVEDEQEWADLVRAEAARRGLGNLTLLHRPFDFWHPADFARSDYLLALAGGTYDVIVVDGKEWTDQVRDQCFWHAEKHIKKGGLIVLDDSYRYPQVKKANQAVRWREYRGVGYCRTGVTSTCIFEY